MKASKAAFLVFLILMSLCIVNSQPVKAAENSWTTMAPMLTERHGFGVAVVNGKIYAIGGYNYDSGLLDINEEYDPPTNTWTTKKPMPTPRNRFGIAVYQNKIYVIGGEIDDADRSTAANEVYDSLTDTWETKTSMPTPRYGLDANAVNGKIYLIGGFQYVWPFNSLDVNEVYDPATDSWTTKAPLPTAVEDYASAVVDNKIYIFGGARSSGRLNQRYNTETDTWSYRASLPTGVDSAAAGATTGVLAPKRIYVIGGKQNLDAVNLNQVYDPETGKWTAGTSLPTPRFGLGVAVVNDVLYAIGGVLGWWQPMTAVNEQYTPIGGTAPPPETAPPVISIVSPENKAYTVSNVSLTFTVSEPTSWIGYSLDEQANVTIAESTTLTGLSDGKHSITVYANDTAGNTGSETIYFSIETQQSEPFPTIWIVAATAIIAIGAVAFVVYFRKIKKTTGKAEKIVPEGFR